LVSLVYNNLNKSPVFNLDLTHLSVPNTFGFMSIKQTKNIQVVPYNPEWPKLFQFEANAIKEALGRNCIAIHHIGSTSVHGLSAKPIIDIITVVVEPTNTIKALEPLGIQYRGEYNIPLHYGFSKRTTIDVNLHVYPENHPEIELNLLFRDYLRSHPTEQEEYVELKKRLLADQTSFIQNNGQFVNYTLRKGDFIRGILKKAGFKRIRMLKCSDETEWDAAKYFRQTYFFDKNNTVDPYTWTFNHPEHAHLILYEGTEIIGYAHIQFWPQARAAMRIIVIDETKRNKNFGKTFLVLCENWLKAKGYTSIHIESSPSALGFYEKNSYIKMPFADPEGHEGAACDIPIGKIL